MKTEQEQIEEMAKELSPYGFCKITECESCVRKKCSKCNYYSFAKRYISKGYRKASEVIDEFVEKVLGKIRYEYENYPNAMTVGTYYQLHKEINELADEMRQEVEK